MVLRRDGNSENEISLLSQSCHYMAILSEFAISTKEYTQ
jgi:hypothetical protein